MNNEIVAIYYYDNFTTKPDSTFEIVACYDSWEDFDKRNVSHYDIYDKTGVCVNEGDPWHKIPSWEEINNHYRSKNNSIV